MLMFGFKRSLLLTAVVGVASSTVFLKRISVDCSSAKESKPNTGKKDKEQIAVYLKNDSVKLLQKLLQERGYKNHKADYVCLHSSANESITYIYEPLYGARTAFRLKGILELPNGNAVGIGRLSNMVGEVKDDNFEVSMPILLNSPANDNSEQHRLLCDLPTRFFKVVNNPYSLPTWKGKLPRTSLNGKSYDSVHVTYISVPINKQLVVDGELCNSLHLDGNRKCVFDLIEEDLAAPPSSSDSTSSVSASDVAVSVSPESAKYTEESSIPDDSNDKECPVCRYMKNGPCKESFLVWDKCLTSLKEGQEITDCFGPTSTMMKCMQQYEYYDIMTAGTDYGRLDSAQDKKQQQ
jgi:hypothetical protein